MLSLIALVALAPSAVVNLHDVPFTDVQIHDKFWAPRIETNRTVSIPHSLEMLVQAGNVKNFELAAAGKHEGYSGPVFMDSDLYKALEAASYSLATHPDADLERKLDAIIAKVAAAQMPDGYLDTHYQVNEPTKRLTNLEDNHELYCAGHMFEAAVAHYRATGRKNFLNIATKYADFLADTFGKGPGQREGYCGHPEIELALIKLWKATGEKKYFDLSRFFIETRGTHFFAREHHRDESRYDGTYWLDDVPIFDHKSIKGHAVRACYLFSGVTDVASVTKDQRLLDMLDRVWANTTYKNMYITGGIGPSASNEGFTTDYDLPNETAYQETCATVALLQWNHRMGLLHGESKYWDNVERSLYNGFLSGVCLQGDKFFYVNPLASKGNHHRSGWFSCACCPPNVTRTLASLGQYIYARDDAQLFVNLFIDSTVQTQVGGEKVKLDVSTNYPWNGKIVLKPSGFKKSTLAVRIPEWCANPRVEASAGVSTATAGGYMKAWNLKDGATITLDLPMLVQRVSANPNVKDDQGKTALQRGPIVYCLEQKDTSVDPEQIFLPMDESFTTEFDPTLLGGVTVLKGKAYKSETGSWSKTLYKPAPSSEEMSVTAIPYYAWDNRDAGGMSVWISMNPPAPIAGGLEQTAAVSLSYLSGYCKPDAIKDGKSVEKSNKHPGNLCHFWPHKGTTEWVQYTWKSPQSLAGCRLYWFDDTGVGECRIPSGYEIQYLDGKDWKPVQAQGYPNKLDEWLNVSFKPVSTTALRLVVKMQPNFAAGIHEWTILGTD